MGNRVQTIKSSKANFPRYLIRLTGYFSSSLLPPNKKFSSRIPVGCKLKHPILFIGSHGLFSNVHPLFAAKSFHFSTVVQPFAKMSQRDSYRLYTQFYDVIDLLKSSTARPSLVTATIAHCLAIKIGALAHLPACTSLLTAYSRAKYFISALALFDEFCDRDVILWNAMINAAVENKSYNVAMQFFVEMTEVGVAFDYTTLLLIVSALSHMKYLKHGKSFHCLSIKVGMLGDCSLCNALLDMYAKCGDLTSSQSMFTWMDCRDVISWNSMLNGFLYNGHPGKSFWCFREMISLGIRVDSMSLSCAISASAASGELSSGQTIHAWGIKQGYNFDISCSNSLISLYSESGDIEASKSVFKEMVLKDVISWNAMIGGFASNGMILETFDMLYKMQLTGYAQPDVATLFTIISLCAERMLLREGKTVHGFTIRRQMISDLWVINSLLDMYSKCNCIIKAELLFNAIPKRDLVSWNVMISGYSRNGYSKEAQSLFKTLTHQCLQLSFSTVLAVISSCISLDSLQFGKSITAGR
ncbi:hypothetical protein ES288_D12G240800v1 [Gossypium darwinii]|nr:hypothetical protein ES288_D12G240800v1 [Gossypium darwinii]